MKTELDSAWESAIHNAERARKAEAEIERLQAELAECKDDAKHFIWLANELGLCIMTMNADQSYFAEDDGDAVTAWRKAIDAARKGEEE